MKRYLLFVSVVCSFALANIPQNPVENQNTQNEEQNNLKTIKDNEAKNIIKSASEGREVIIEKEAEDEVVEQKNERIFYEEAILNWHYALQKENPRKDEVLGKTTENVLVKNVKAEDMKNDEANSKNEKLAVVKGFCFITDDINVGKQPASLRAECQTNYGAVTIFGNLVNLNEKASLVLDAKYIEKDGWRFEVKESIVTNEDKTSYNIATYVNDRKVSQVALESLSTTSTEFKTYTNQYLRALEQSKRQQQLVVTNVGNGTMGYPVPQTLTNVQPPDPLQYLALAGTSIVSTAIKSTADVMKKDLPYLYQIVGKTKIWIDIKVNEQGEYVK